ncbi:hypothetical protein HD554DRAFT_971845 [Boletus coccyginus]|nr:hypothetical protein HD554DRAFT_971845 [Boletus coccyginus]
MLAVTSRLIRETLSSVHSRALFVTTRDGSGSLEFLPFTCDRADSITDSNAELDSDASSPSPGQLQPELTPFTHVVALYFPLIRDTMFVLSVQATCPPDTSFVTSNERTDPRADGPICACANVGRGRERVRGCACICTVRRGRGTKGCCDCGGRGDGGALCQSRDGRADVAPPAGALMVEMGGPACAFGASRSVDDFLLVGQ